MSANNWADCPSCKKAEVLREDYEIGIVDGWFYLIYSAVCRAGPGASDYLHRGVLRAAINALDAMNEPD